MFSSIKFDEIMNEFVNNNNSHSYMIYTNDFEMCKKDLEILVKAIFSSDNIKKNKVDYFIVNRSDKKNILKDDITNLLDNFKKSSYINKKRIYVVEEAHKLNPTTANLILKFLEEPSDGIIGFFLTDNVDLVLSTIKSRCQMVNVFYDKSNSLVCNEFNRIDDLFFNNNRYLSMLKVKSVLKNEDRNQLIENFKEYLENLSHINDINNFYKIKLVNNAIMLLDSNVNFDYVFDYLLIKRK